jgi:hypothetical protein
MVTAGVATSCPGDGSKDLEQLPVDRKFVVARFCNKTQLVCQRIWLVSCQVDFGSERIRLAEDLRYSNYLIVRSSGMLINCTGWFVHWTSRESERLFRYKFMG